MRERLNLKNEPASNVWPLSFFWIQTIIILIVFFDQSSKFLASKFFTISCNYGIAFGVNLSGFWSIFWVSSVLVLLTYLLSRGKNQYTAISILLIMGGGLSNLLDRLLIGCVRDFMDVGFWPSFNLADSAITVGSILLIFSMIYRKSNERV